MYEKRYDIVYEFIRGLFVQFKDGRGKLNGTARDLCTTELFNCLNIEITNLYMDTKIYRFDSPPSYLYICHNVIFDFYSHGIKTFEIYQLT